MIFADEAICGHVMHVCKIWYKKTIDVSFSFPTYTPRFPVGL